MFYLIYLLLCGISFAPLFLPKLDIWHAQGIFAQGCILLMFTWMFFENRKIRPNIPLGLLHLWIGGFTLVICYLSQVRGAYDMKHFLLYFNFICILVLYKSINYLNRNDIYRLLRALRYVIIITLITCVFQKFHYSQFFTFIVPPQEKYHLINNLMVGFIGNGTHLSGFLACSIPLFLLKSTREDILALILMGLVLTDSGTSMHDPSISGFVIAGVIWAYYIKKDPKKIFWTVLVVLALLPLVRGHLPEKFFNTQGRVAIWAYYFKMLKQVPITGAGLGATDLIYLKTPFPQARHLHLEYLQYWFEIGAIGLILIFNLIHKFFIIKAQDRMELCLKASVLGFLVSCLFNYPSHLWLPVVWTMFFYGAFMTISERKYRWA